MSASAARQTANTANAQLSTGPTSPEGKASSSQNARKHGLTASELVIGPKIAKNLALCLPITNPTSLPKEQSSRHSSTTW
jgi:hypothetical protein